MRLYLDTSALVKRYLRESGTADIEALVRQADLVGTSLVTHAETSAAMAKAVRMNWLDRPAAEKIRQEYLRHWGALTVIQLTESVAALAGDLAWNHGLRGFDAVHLASALTWQNALQLPIILATFDRQLWQAAPQVGVAVWPEIL